MKNIIFTQANGVVAVVRPAEKSDLEKIFGPITNKQYEDHVWQRSVPADAINPRWVLREEINIAFNDQTFRDAWVDGGEQEGIIVDMPKAREIHMKRVRAARDAALKKLDIETMKGRDVQDQKQVLRDLPANTDLTVATTPDELKAIWPEQLRE
jgi:hypothetical protein